MTREAVAGGLSDAEAAARLLRDGHNDLPSAARRSPLRLAAEVVREPMFALLVAAAVLYAAIGDSMEALLLLAFATISVSIAVVQQTRSERVLDALRDLTSPRALVIRAGRRLRIPGREVVRGDTIIVMEGDRVPADAVLMKGGDVEVDESLLTGESLPVRKRPMADADAAPAAPGGNDVPWLYSGSLVIRGSGIALVRATGAATEIGRIGLAVSTLETEQPRLQAQTRRVVVAFGVAGIAVSTVAVILHGLLRGSWLEALLGGIALGMSMLPEEFPLVLTVFTVMGAWRLSQSRVLTRRAAAIDTLGAATVLCTDKTGTLTHNRMSVVALKNADENWRDGGAIDAIAGSAQLTLLLETARLAGDLEAPDPMERALATLADAVSGPANPGTLVREYPLRPELPAKTRAWHAGHGDLTIASKGAPEAVATLCRLSAGETAALRARVDALASEGARVLAVARGSLPAADLPDAHTGFALTLLGLVAFADPLRETVPDAVRECHSAGIRVVMITGDYPETARAIARRAGIDDGAVLTGRELERMDDRELMTRARTVSVFARITPAQKLDIVKALKADGQVVAMTGDGVNDAPALKAAHIGIAMGGRGNDVAREASSIVLLDDDFGSIVHAIRLGRRIYDNLQKAMAYIFAIHIPIAGLALLPLLLGWPLVLTPMLIALLELIIDPACSVVLEAEQEEADVMRRPPRSPTDALLSPGRLAWSTAQGLMALGSVLLVFVPAVAGMTENQARSLAFVTLVGVNLALIFANRTFSASLFAALTRPNATLWWGLGFVACAMTLMFSWTELRSFFALDALRALDVLYSVGAAVLLLAALELLKVIVPPMKPRRGTDR